MSANHFRQKARFGYIAVGISAILFSAKSVFFKICYAHGISPMALMVLRTGFSLPFFMAMAAYPFFIKKSNRPLPISRRDFMIIGALGLLGYYIASVLDFYGLVYVSAGTERMILYVYPSLVVLLSAWFFKKPIPGYMVLPLLLSYAGIVLSFGGEISGETGGRPFLGGTLVFLSALCYAIFLIGQGKMINRIGPQRLGAYGMLAASLAVVIHFLVSQPVHDLVQPSEVYLIAAFTAVFCTVLPVYLVGYGVQVIGPGRAAIVSSVGPVATYALAALMLGEAPGILQLGGLGLVVLGTLMLTRESPESKVTAGVESKHSSAPGPECGSNIRPQGKSRPST